MSVMLKQEESPLFLRVRRLAKSARMLAGDEIPVPALNAFYEQMYPSRSDFLKRHWRWLYRTDYPAQAKSPLVVMDEGQVIGHIGLIPLTLRRNHDEREATWACDIAILPKYQGKAWGALLVTEVMVTRPLCIGFPNRLSQKLTVKLGWKDQPHTVGLSLLLRPNRHPKVRELSTNKRGVNALAALAGVGARTVLRARTLSRKRLSASPVAADYLPAFSERGTVASLHAVRTAEFLRWRVMAHPRIEEHFVLNFQNGGDKRYSAIARVVEEEGCRRLHLLSLRPRLLDPRGLSDFFAGVIRWSLDQDIHVISLVTSEPAVARAARWWLPILSQLCYAYHSNTPAGEEFLSGPGQLWEYIDGDFDLAYMS